MEIYTDLDEIKEPFVKPYVTIGNFDGVHVGHQYLFSEVVARAYRNKGTSVVITFNPHPLQVVRPEAGIKLISTCDQKRELIAHAGIDVLIIIPFTREFAATPAAQFVDEILLEKIGMVELVVGYDYCFGKGREGDTAFLKEQGRRKGFPVTVMEPYEVGGVVASSTEIRRLVAEGNMRAVRRLQGRYYQIHGEVQMGKQRGAAELGFPTANLHISGEDLCPRHGVYVCQVVYGGTCYGGVLNIGINPTFTHDAEGNRRITAETFIFDFNEDIYGKQIKVNLLRFLRDEKRFSGPAELVTQINQDVKQARQVLAEAEQELRLSCEEKFNR
ncbi:MAG: bifunctional riboflavin kinase/FAD synthetase [Desulfurivibrionaceae bacterium]|nr:bifunctional riboflavin kinase/FAD synthetase [Desulfurivibrionaceae bacterium]